MIEWEVIVAVSFIAGIVIFYYNSIRPEKVAQQDQSGWVYFIGSKDDDYAPIRISLTQMDPKMELRMLQASSPQRLEVIHSFHCEQAPLVCAQIQEDLRAYHVHGDWYDRDAARAYLTMVTAGAK
jgi:hypothetical protein